jgi:hypothetical protein
MVEITAWKDGKQVQLKQGRKMEIKMRSYVDGNRFNLYNLDTTARNWKYLGKDRIEREKTGDNINNEIFVWYDTVTEGPALPGVDMVAAETGLEDRELLKLRESEPIPPRKADPKRYRFNIDVNPEEFPELAAFKGVQFEVDPKEKNFSSEVFKTQWTDAKLEEIKKCTSYRILLTAVGTERYRRFIGVPHDFGFYLPSRGKRYVRHTEVSQSYLVYPVYEGKDYEAAMKKFNANYASYKQKVKEREAEIKAELKQKQEEYVASQKKLAEQQKEKLKQQYDQQLAGQVRADKIFRAFAVSGFGVYNCDCPQMFPKGAPITAKFEDEQGQPVRMISPYLVEKGRNAMFYLYGGGTTSGTTFKYNRHSGNMIFGATIEGRVAVFTSEDFDKIPADAKSYTFIMDILDRDFTDVDELKKYLGI